MAGLATLEHKPEIVSPAVELGGRRFPRTWGFPAADPPSTPPARKIRESQKQKELPDLLCESIIARLAWSQVKPVETERPPLVEAYVRSLNELASMRQDVEQMLRAACKANLEFRQGVGTINLKVKDKVMAEKLGQMLAESACDWLPTRNVLNAALVSAPIADLRQQLGAALRQAVGNFTTQFFGTLAKLVDRELVGLVEWHSNQCCSYHFFKRAVVQENDGATQERVVKETLFEQVTERDRTTGRQIIGKRTIEKVKGKGRHIHRLARHEHEVMNAIHTTIRNSTVIMPPQVGRLIEAIPQWLYPFIQVIDGDIFRERIIERDVGVESWSDVSVRDEPIIGCEPGVILGPYVLTGWGPREVEAERRRREAAETAFGQRQAKRSSRQERLFWLAGTLVTGVACMWLLGATVVATAQFSASVAVLAILNLYAVVQAVRLHGTALGTPSRVQHYLAGMSIALGLLGGAALLSLGYAFNSGDGWFGSGLIASSLVGASLLHRLWS